MASEKCSESTDRRRGEAGGKPAAIAISASSFESSRAVTSGEGKEEGGSRLDLLALGSAPSWAASERQGDP